MAHDPPSRRISRSDPRNPEDVASDGLRPEVPRQASLRPLSQGRPRCVHAGGLSMSEISKKSGAADLGSAGSQPNYQTTPNSAADGPKKKPSLSKLDHALSYAEHGWKIFPVAPGEKDPPCIKNWG